MSDPVVVRVRVPVTAYAVRVADAADELEVVVCDDGTAWVLTEDPATKTLRWSQDAVPPIPGSAAALAS